MRINFMKLRMSAAILFVSLALSGCFNSNSSIPYYVISDEFAEFCWFETNSWWYFQNDSTLSADTVRILEVNNSQRFDTDDHSYNYEAVEQFLNSSAFQITEFELTAGNYEADSGVMNSLMRMYFSDGSYEHVFTPQYSIGEEIILGDDIGVYTNVSVESSMEINGNTYTDVWHTRRVVSVNMNAEYNYWIAKNYGLVKRTANIEGEMHSFSLVSSNLKGKE